MHVLLFEIVIDSQEKVKTGLEGLTYPSSISSKWRCLTYVYREGRRQKEGKGWKGERRGGEKSSISSLFMYFLILLPSYLPLVNRKNSMLRIFNLEKL